MKCINQHFLMRYMVTVCLSLFLYSLGFAQDRSDSITLNYQGELHNANGAPLVDSASLQFRLYTYIKEVWMFSI